MSYFGGTNTIEIRASSLDSQRDVTPTAQEIRDFASWSRAQGKVVNEGIVASWLPTPAAIRKVPAYRARINSRGLKVLAEDAIAPSRLGRLNPGVGCKFLDAASQVRLRGKSLNSGTSALQKAGLVRRPGRGGAYEFIDPKTGAARAKWVPKTGKEPAHWSKFEPSGNQSHYLNDAGRAVTSTDRAHRIPSNGGGPIGGTGPGSPTPVR